jgi:DNA-binding transcriptional MocR family regulator
VVVSEPLTYPGFRSIAAQLGLRLIPCPGDEDGPSPEALRDICAREEPRAVYLVPTMQNPTATTLSEDRRRRLARVMDGAGVWLIEDDPYSRLLEAPPPAITSFRRGHSVYIGSLAKTLSPGLRIAFVACAAPQDSQALVRSLRAVAQMPAPLMAAVVVTWIREGRAEALLRAVRAEARARRALAAEMLPAAQGAPESLHVWLPLANVETVEAVRRGAQQRGLALVTHEAFAVGPTNAPGVRISLGGPGRRAVLADALRSLADVCYPETRR